MAKLKEEYQSRIVRVVLVVGLRLTAGDARSERQQQYGNPSTHVPVLL